MGKTGLFERGRIWIPHRWKYIRFLGIIHLQSTVELHLSGLIGAACHPDTQKIRIIGFFF